MRLRATRLSATGFNRRARQSGPFADAAWTLFDTAGNLSPLVSCTRTGSASYIDSTGTMQAAAAGTLRVSYDPLNLAAGPFLMTEEGRTNLLLNSATLSTQSVTVTAAAHTLSFYGSGTVTLSGASTGTVVGTGAYPARRTFTFTPTAGTLTLTVSGAVQFAQLEAASNASSWIPTTGASAARGSENIVAPTLAQMGLSIAAGTVYVDALPETQRGGYFSLDDGTASTVLRIAPLATQTLYRNTVGGANQVSISSAAGTSPLNARLKTALRWANNDFAAALNGTQVFSNSTGTVQAWTGARIGNTSGVPGYLQGRVYQLAIFPSLPDTRLQELTTP